MLAKSINANGFPDKTTSARQNVSDLLLIVRGVAALYVVIWHAGGYLGTYPSILNTPGRTAVWVFFGISGYVIAHGFVHRRYSMQFGDLRDFYVNRFLRIYPIFLLLSFIGWITEVASTGASPLVLADLPVQLLAFQFNQDYKLNGVFWTLGIEIHFYLLAPILAMPLLSKRRFWYAWFPLGMYGAAIGWQYYATTKLGWSWDARNIVGNIPHFMAGMIACKFVEHCKPNPLRFRLAITGACFLIGYTSYLYHMNPGAYWSARGILLVDFAILLFVCAHASWSGSAGIFASLATFLGTLSYGLYAWHAYWMRLFPQIAEQVVVVTAVSIFSAYVTYRLVELPALRLKRAHSSTLN